jgi:protein involved in polysaccharide export with SLBB domain
VRSVDGKVGVYDLFKAQREGDLREDPLLRPGDEVEVKKATRRVSVSGEVRRPGIYQLLENEGVNELISYYGDGLGVSAKSDMVVLTRRASEAKPESESIVFDLGGKELPVLLDGDSIRVASREEYLPIVYVEGAVKGRSVQQEIAQQNTQAVQEKASSTIINPTNNTPLNQQNPASKPETSQNPNSTNTSEVIPANYNSSSNTNILISNSYALLRFEYRRGTTLSILLQPIKDKILDSADLEHAFILRKNVMDPIPIDLEQLIFANNLSLDIELLPEDRVIIPDQRMNVLVSGEVTRSSLVPITGMTRLREVVYPLLTRYSSIRDVKIKTTDGFEKSYDLFKADRYGDLSQDPFLRPGDEIRLSSLTNLATIQGEVKRPGTYQLLPGEGLKELIDLYADGFTEKANTSRLTLLHYLSDSSPVGEKLQFDYAKFPDIKLRLYDVVTVPSLQELLPVVWFEGAVGVSSTGSSPETSQRIAYNFVPGETVSQAALNNRKLFSAVSDLASGYIIHADGSTTAIDLAKFIYDYDLTNDLPLKANDTIIVPFRQFFVSVSGAVRYPGRYPYIPKRTWEYYIGLAGGFDTDKNSGQKITIYDVKSQKVAIAGREIQPEDNIVAESNSFTYNMMKVSSIISTVLSLTVLIINLLGL